MRLVKDLEKVLEKGLVKDLVKDLGTVSVSATFSVSVVRICHERDCAIFSFQEKIQIF